MIVVELNYGRDIGFVDEDGQVHRIPQEAAMPKKPKKVKLSKAVKPPKLIKTKSKGGY